MVSQCVVEDCPKYRNVMKTTSKIKHRDRYHSKAQFNCDLCDKSFNDPGVLKRHMGSHNSVSCFLCHTDLNPNSLLRHIKRAHGQKASGEFVIKMCRLCLNQNCDTEHCGGRENRRSRSEYFELAAQAAEKVMSISLTEKELFSVKDKPNILIVRGQYKSPCVTQVQVSAFKKLIEKSSGFKPFSF